VDRAVLDRYDNVSEADLSASVAKLSAASIGMGFRTV